MDEYKKALEELAHAVETVASNTASAYQKLANAFQDFEITMADVRYGMRKLEIKEQRVLIETGQKIKLN